MQAKKTYQSIPKSTAKSTFTKQQKLLAVFSIILIIALGIFAYCQTTSSTLPQPSPDLVSVKEYIPGAIGTQGNVNATSYYDIDPSLEIGANQYGYAVFKAPDSAFAYLQRYYPDGINLIQQEFDLPELDNSTIKTYQTYGWQVTSGDEHAREQAQFVTQFLDIYENSFKPEDLEK